MRQMQATRRSLTVLLVQFFLGVLWSQGLLCQAASVPADISAVQPGPVRVEAAADSLTVSWPDESSRTWKAEFSLDPAKPLITAISAADKVVITGATPLYWCDTGTRRGGWDNFFDNPATHGEGMHRSVGEFKLQSAKARSVGYRVEVSFSGLRLGLFQGSVAYTFYPGSRLIQQEAVVSTSQPDVAYFYDAGLRMTIDSDRVPGLFSMGTKVSYYDTTGKLLSVASDFERRPETVRYRAIAVPTGKHAAPASSAAGSIAAFPPPHAYFSARDVTNNLRYVWHSAWRGEVSIGIRQTPDDNSPYNPGINAPPGTEQRMSLFLLVSDRTPADVLGETLRYTNHDRFPSLPGYHTVAPHWHWAYTMQALENGFDWTPPFKPVLKAMGVEAAIDMDFHGDGHPNDLNERRLSELDAFFRACKTQSDSQFLLLPSEEANVYLGGHWSLMFPKPVYWFMKRPEGTPLKTSDPRYGTVYHIGSAADLLEMVRAEGGYMYETHPRTKGSTGFPDKILNTDYFRDPRYLGVGWKAMPSDLSLPRQGERSFKTLDDLNNWGYHKRLLGEVDVFQIDSTHELYSHMNVNYVRLDKLPAWGNYGQLLDAMARGDYFISTGEVLLPQVRISGGQGDSIAVEATARWTFPLKLAEIVWGDGTHISRKTIPLESTREFGSSSFQWQAYAPGWKWARVGVWDVAGNGGFTNPVWR